MIKITIDGLSYGVKAGENLLETCISLGLDIPYFCYHPAMGSVGACRQCAVRKYQNAEDKKGRIVMSCMEPVQEGMIISLNEPEVKEFRSQIIEGLMTNHPHDCPVCDEGGECHLQDMTVLTGHAYRRFPFKKRSHVSQNLGPFIHHEMNRCIQCYRCVRFYRDYAGGHDLDVYGAGNRIYFGRKEDGILESEFSGNLVEVCPTGVFTDKTLKRHFTRKWDLTNAPSVCVHCSLGCNTLLGERYGMVRRVMTRYNGDVNGYFLCDRGRFGYEFINHPGRIKNARIKNPQTNILEDIAPNRDIISEVKKFLTGNVIGIGSPRASMESNFALQQLVGKENFYHGINNTEYQLIRQSLSMLSGSLADVVSLKEMEQSDMILILGEDITQTAPVMALAVRQAVRNDALEKAAKANIPGWNDTAVRDFTQNSRNPLYICSYYSTKLDEIAKGIWNAGPDDIANLGLLIAHFLDAFAPSVESINKEQQNMARTIAEDLKKAKKPLLIAGINSANDLILQALQNILLALNKLHIKPQLALAFPECNSVGMAILDGKPLDEALERMINEKTDAVFILENDIYRRASAEKIRFAFNNQSGKIIVMDHILTATASRADIVLPVATYAESSGTLVNNECRAQRYYPVLKPGNLVSESWQLINEIRNEGGLSFDEMVASIAQNYHQFIPVMEKMPRENFRFYNEKIARQTMRYSGRTAMNAGISVHNESPVQDHEAPLNYSMEGYKGRPPADLIPYYWAPGWNSPQAMNKYLDHPDGSVKDYNPGIKIVPGNTNGHKKYFNTYVPQTVKHPHDFLFVPLFMIFGSEELSAYGKAVNERIPYPYLLISRIDSEKNHITPENTYKVVINGNNIDAVIKSDERIPAGIAALLWLPQMPFMNLPAWGRILFELSQDH